MDSRHSILIIDDDVAMRETLTDILEDKGYAVYGVESGREGMDKARETNFDVALIDLKLPDMEGVDLLKHFSASFPDMACFIVTGHASMQTAIATLREGAADYFVKPLHIEKMLHSITTVLERQRIRAELKKSEQENLRNLVIQSITNSILQASIEDLPLDDLLDLTLDLLINSSVPIPVPALCGTIHIVEAADGSLVLKARKTKKGHDFPLCARVEQGACLCGKATASQETVVLDEGVAHESVCCESIGPHRHFCAPIKTRSGVAAVLSIIFGENEWPKSHEEILVVSVINTLADIFQRIQAEKLRAEAESQYRQAQKMEALGSLAGGIAHDFNNILTAILGYGELVYENLAPGSQQQEDLMQVIKAGKRARELVNQILTFSRQREEQELQPVHIHLLVGEALKLLEASLPTTIEIRKYINKECGTVLADPSQLHQVIMNLCTNAFHAMQDQQHGILEVRLERQEMGAGKEGAGAFIILTVKDTGCGMDAATLEHVFDPYFTTKTPDKGTGLGLSVVHGIVKGLGGTITVESDPGQGTTFTLSFPSTENVDVGEEEMQPPPSAGGTECILVVDDDEYVALLIKQQLTAKGYKVMVCSTSREALEEFRSQSGRYDLVFTDNIMPKMTGIELSRELLTIRPDLPIILCSGAGESIAAEELAEVGIRSFLKKPFTSNQLLQEVRQVLDDKGPELRDGN